MFSIVKENCSRQIKVVISGGLGDCILATPFIRHFKQRENYKKIICAVPEQAVEIFDCNPHVDQLIPCRRRELYFWAAPESDCDVFSPYIGVMISRESESDIFVNASHLLNPNLVSLPIIHQVAKYHGLTLKDDALDIFTTEDDEKWADNYFKKWNGQPTVLLNTQSQMKEKNLTKILGQKIVNELVLKYVVIQMGDNRLRLENTEVVEPMPGIRRSAAFFKKLSCVITVDSFPGHLAHAVGTPAVVLFGPSNPGTFGHSGNCNIRSSDCPPCEDTERKVNCTSSVCLKEMPSDIIVGLRVNEWVHLYLLEHASKDFQAEIFLIS